MSFLGVADAPSSLTAHFLNRGPSDWQSQEKVSESLALSCLNRDLARGLLCSMTGGAPSIVMTSPPRPVAVSSRDENARNFVVDNFFLNNSALPHRRNGGAECIAIEACHERESLGVPLGRDEIPCSRIPNHPGDPHKGLQGFPCKGAWIKDDVSSSSIVMKSAAAKSLAAKEAHSEEPRASRGRSRRSSRKKADEDWAPCSRVRKREFPEDAERRSSDCHKEEPQRPRRVNPRRKCKVQAAPFATTLALLRAHVARCKVLAEVHAEIKAFSSDLEARRFGFSLLQLLKTRLRCHQLCFSCSKPCGVPGTPKYF